MADDRNDPTGFETDIKPLFREIDRQSMLRHFDLSGHTTTSAGMPKPSSPASEKAPCHATAPGPKRRSASSNGGPRMASRNDR